MNKLVIFALIATLLFTFFSCEKKQEPTYEGKPLSVWVEDLNDA